ncbi:MAG: VWA domain-containing protein, partial [Planctomycetota bacterium]
LRIYAFHDENTLLYDLKKGSKLPENLDKLVKLKSQGKFTRLGQCILDAKTELLRAGYTIAAMVLFTDGQSNAGIPPTKAAYRLLAAKIPLFIFGIGTRDVEKDLELFGLNTRKTAKVGDYIPFHFKVRSKGIYNKDLFVYLKKNGKEVHRQFLHLGKPKQGKSFLIQEVRFKYKVSMPGKYEFTVEIPPLKDEANKKNNRLSFWLDVKDKKLWVLYVEGYPRWEYRYLKNALIRDRTLKVQCLLASADPEYPQESSPDVESLTGFPNTSIPFDSKEGSTLPYTEKQKEDILRKLKRYNVIIFGDIPPSYFSAAQLAAIAQFVEEGGGFIMISGEKFSPHAYYSTPIANILPVQLERPDLVEIPLDETLSQPFRPKLSPEGERHIIMRFENDLAQNKDLWEGKDGLPGFYWFSTVKKVKPGAVVLAYHPTRKNKSGPYPLFCYHNYGQGKVFFSALDSTWRWRAGVGDRYFYSFWSQVIRFTATGSFEEKDRDFILSTGQNSYIQGKTVDIYAIVRKRKTKTVEIQVYGPFDKKKIPQYEEKGMSKELARKTYWSKVLNLLKSQGKARKVSLPRAIGAMDNYQGDFVPYRQGAFFLVLGKPYVTPQGKLNGGDIKMILVKSYDREKLQVLLNDKILQTMASITGGKYFHLFGEARIPHKSKMGFPLPGKKKVVLPSKMEELSESMPSHEETFTDVQKRIYLWRKWWILPLLLLLLIGEWFFRKLYRLP